MQIRVLHTLGLTVLLSAVGASAFAFVPLASNAFAGAEGTGHARVHVFGAGAYWLAWHPAAAVRSELGAGAGAVWLALSAEPNAGYSARVDHLTSGMAFASASLDLRLSGRLALRTGVLVGSSLPRAVVRFEGREVASWGHVFAAASAAVEVSVSE